MKYKEVLTQEYKKLSETMDKRDEFYKALQEHFDKYGHIPYKYLASWNTYQEDERSWRDQPKVVLRIKKAARKAAKNRMRKERRK